ncbi:exosortase B [Thiomicrorhabdus arctica]|jgi:exosortase B|uniref:exosortase B n=1 Tax=Thiomicrorhabdus arctica TaxID=131540 RepID=UPI000381523D|nr:exosortase B [Thiomicrorhabdus arctica]
MSRLDVYKNKKVLIWLPIIAGLIFLFTPTYIELYHIFWSKDEQGHGPLVLVIALFLFWQKKELFLKDRELTGQSTLGWSLLFISLIVYILAKWQYILVAEVAVQIPILIALILITSGYSVLKRLWFPLFFLIFIVPLPGSVVDAITMPMKIAVSNVVEMVLYNFDYPIARDGVILQIGYYKLLVADACAGLHTVFSLEAMGLLYLHLVKRDSFLRNVSLAMLIIPISFVANVIRVIALVLITYYYGDEVGQGFLHEFAGFVLYGTALIFIISTDIFLQKLELKLAQKKARRAATEESDIDSF